MFCDFVLIENNTYECYHCGNIVSSEDGDIPVLPCSSLKLSSKDVDLAEKIKNFSKSLIDHAKNNFGLCDNKQIEERFKICENCEYFNKSSCSMCGCPIIRTKNYISKLSWSSEKCPINKW
jgi:hypothetical protein